MNKIVTMISIVLFCIFVQASLHATYNFDNIEKLTTWFENETKDLESKTESEKIRLIINVYQEGCHLFVKNVNVDDSNKDKEVENLDKSILITSLYDNFGHIILSPAPFSFTLKKLVASLDSDLIKRYNNAFHICMLIIQHNPYKLPELVDFVAKFIPQSIEKALNNKG